MSQAALTPTMVRAPRGGDTMEIDWADGHVGRYPLSLLRGYCPCAGCQGHSGEIKFLPGSSADLQNITEVGNYGLGLSWADGHDSGIYTYRYLRSLCSCEKCLPGSAHERHGALGRE